MNGRDVAPVTARSLRDELRGVAAGRRAVVAAARQARRESRNGWIFAGCWVVALPTVIGTLTAIEHFSRRAPEISSSRFTLAPGEGVGWFDPRYREDMRSVLDAQPNWLLGRHRYSIRDLMGRKL
jgi:hypothetical protein